MRNLPAAEIVQGLLGLFPEPRYLEIGVSKGDTFHMVKSPHKVAVDPRFRFNVEEARTSTGCTYHSVTSDVFFGEIADPADRFEVIYLDGLHTVEQTLRDFTNALFFLAPGGVILIDDVRPKSYVASLPDLNVHRALKEASGIESRAWMGDVYRLVFFIESFFQQISYRTVQDNHGQLIAWRRRRESVPERKIEDVGRIPYEWVMTEKQAFRLTPFARILEELQTAASSGIGIIASGVPA